MKLVQLFFLFFLIVPFVEIYFLLEVGGVIGAFPTIFLVVLTAVWGGWLLRQQGFATWQRLQNNLAQGQIPAYEVVEGPIILVGGALLLTPGFMTDLLGFACLIPSSRKWIAQWLMDHYLVNVSVGEVFKQARANDQIIEGEVTKRD